MNCVPGLCLANTQFALRDKKAAQGLVHLGCNIRLINKGSYPISPCAGQEEQVTARRALTRLLSGKHWLSRHRHYLRGRRNLGQFFFGGGSFFFFNPCASCIPLLMVPRLPSSTNSALTVTQDSDVQARRLTRQTTNT